MKKYLPTILLLLIPAFGFAQTGIGTTSPDASAALEVASTTAGFLPPRMTTAQRNAISNPADGLTIYNTSAGCIQTFQNGSWYDPCSTLTTTIRSLTGRISVDSLYGGTGDDYANKVIQTSDGGYIFVGYTNSSATGNLSSANHGSYDCWVVKINAAGNIVWDRVLGGAGEEYAASVVETPDNGFIIGARSNSSLSGDVTDTTHGGYDYWIVKLDARGNTSWNVLLGGGGEEDIRSVRPTFDGGYILVGNSSVSGIAGNITGPGKGGTDIWIVKLDANGGIVWNKLIGGGGDETGNSIEQCADGGYIVGGYTYSSASGHVTGTNHGNTDYWIVKLDGSGNITWNRLIGGASQEILMQTLPAADGGYISIGRSVSSASGDITGTNHGGGNDYWIVKMDASGNITWDRLLGGAGEDQGYAICQVADGGYVAVGAAASSQSGDVSAMNHGGYDYWVVKLDASGGIVWNRLLGGNDTEAPTSIEQTADGGFVLAGWSVSSLSGDIINLNHGGKDCWITKLNPLGVVVR